MFVVSLENTCKMLFLLYDEWKKGKRVRVFFLQVLRGHRSSKSCKCRQISFSLAFNALISHQSGFYVFLCPLVV